MKFTLMALCVAAYTILFSIFTSLFILDLGWWVLCAPACGLIGHAVGQWEPIK